MQLVLFDIDGTLLHGYGAGSRAMERAGRALFGTGFSLENIDFAGALDPWICREAARAMGASLSDEQHERFHEAYIAELARELERAVPPPRILPGVHAALARVREWTDTTMGLLTGNYTRAAPLKLRAAGIDPTQFAVGAFGDDAPTRRDLVPVALKRWAALGADPKPERTIVVGDTPRDVDCARCNGCRCLAVATGRHSMEQLSRAGAHAVVRDLTEISALLAMLSGS